MCNSYIYHPYVAQKGDIFVFRILSFYCVPFPSLSQNTEGGGQGYQNKLYNPIM